MTHQMPQLSLQPSLRLLQLLHHLGHPLWGQKQDSQGTSEVSTTPLVHACPFAHLQHRAPRQAHQAHRAHRRHQGHQEHREHQEHQERQERQEHQEHQQCQECQRQLLQVTSGEKLDLVAAAVERWDLITGLLSPSCHDEESTPPPHPMRHSAWDRLVPCLPRGPSEDGKSAVVKERLGSHQHKGL